MTTDPVEILRGTDVRCQMTEDGSRNAPLCMQTARWVWALPCDCWPAGGVPFCDEHADELREAAGAFGGFMWCSGCDLGAPGSLLPLHAA